MPVTEGIIVPITADAAGLEKGVERAKKSIFSLKLEQEKYEGMAFTEKNTLRLIEYNRKIQDLQTEITQLTNKGKKGFDELGNAIQGGNNPLTKGYSLLRQIAYILPGIGIAGILGFATEPLFKYLGTLTGISEAAKLAKKEQDDFNKSLDHGVGSAMKTGFELRAYINIAGDLSKSMAERNRALAEANKLYGEHNEKLSLTNINTEQVKKQVEGYTQALIDNAIAAKYGDKLADGYFKQREAARAYGEELTKLNKLKIEYDKDMAFTGGTGKLMYEYGAEETDAIANYKRQLVITQKATEDYKKVTKDLTNTSGDYISVLTKANEELAKFGKLEKEVKEPRVKAEKDSLHGGWEKKKAPLYSALGDTENGNAAKRLQLLIKGIGVEANKTGIEVTDAIIKSNNEMLKGQYLALKWRDTLESIGNVVVPEMNRAFIGMFETLMQGGASAIGTLMQSIGNLIKRLISAAMAAATLAAILAATGLGGKMGFKGGFGDIFKKIFSDSTGLKLASGGITNGPTRALIGEGKEREVVTPLSQLRNIIGSVGGQRSMPVPQLYMRGADMWIMWQRQQQQNLRNY